MQTSLTCLFESLLQNLVAETVALDIHLSGSDTLLGACHLKVHVAEMILAAEDVGKHCIFHRTLVGDKTHSHASNRAFHLHA